MQEIKNGIDRTHLKSIGPFGPAACEGSSIVCFVCVWCIFFQARKKMHYLYLSALTIGY